MRFITQSVDVLYVGEKVAELTFEVLLTTAGGLLLAGWVLGWNVSRSDNTFVVQLLSSYFYRALFLLWREERKRQGKPASHK